MIEVGKRFQTNIHITRFKLQNKQTNKINKVCIVHFNPIYPTFDKTTKQPQQQNQNKTRDIQAYF